jgi:hypothetical protein
LFLKDNVLQEDWNQWDVCQLAYRESGGYWEEPNPDELFKRFSFGENDLEFKTIERFEEVTKLKTFRVLNEYGGIIPPSVIKDWLKVFDPGKYKYAKKAERKQFPDFEAKKFKGGSRNNCWKDHC